MKKYSNLSESEIQRLTKLIVESEHDKEELDEIVGTKIEDFFQGVKGLYQGEGYYFFKYLSKIKNRSALVKKEVEDIKKFVEELLQLKGRIDKVKNIAPEKKFRLLNLIDTISKIWVPFELPFTKSIDEINALASQKLKGERLDVIPGSKKSAFGTDYMKDRDETTNQDNLKNPEFVDPNQQTKKSTTSSTGNQLSQKNISPIPDEELSDEEKMLLGKTVNEEIKRFKQLIK